MMDTCAPSGVPDYPLSSGPGSDPLITARCGRPAIIVGTCAASGPPNYPRFTDRQPERLITARSGALGGRRCGRAAFRGPHRARKYPKSVRYARFAGHFRALSRLSDPSTADNSKMWPAGRYRRVSCSGRATGVVGAGGVAGAGAAAGAAGGRIARAWRGLARPTPYFSASSRTWAVILAW